ncbi:hypothetical protein Pint_05658 [Pistacia integerrima]|uniref:Uncharacterized protein n=1 Tax=Pistacia integerrima TaxID=434235 RepID=A0ACC0Z9Z9_9ROSI|nr:hypothetical protein Pint_05658 [Pistacia integerrima]
MADGSSSSTSNSFHLLKEVKSHEVAIAELNSLPSSRTVYQKNANIYFRTTIQKATASEQKHLEAVKRKLDQLNAS